jgi:hypothetical protein
VTIEFERNMGLPLLVGGLGTGCWLETEPDQLIVRHSLYPRNTWLHPRPYQIYKQAALEVSVVQSRLPAAVPSPPRPQQKPADTKLQADQRLLSFWEKDSGAGYSLPEGNSPRKREMQGANAYLCGTLNLPPS